MRAAYSHDPTRATHEAHASQPFNATGNALGFRHHGREFVPDLQERRRVGSRAQSIRSVLFETMQDDRPRALAR
jgi:hypothetical protein